VARCRNQLDHRSCRLPSSSVARILIPVVLPPGWASELTRPLSTKSSATVTIGIWCCAGKYKVDVPFCHSYLAGTRPRPVRAGAVALRRARRSCRKDPHSGLPRPIGSAWLFRHASPAQAALQQVHGGVRRTELHAVLRSTRTERGHCRAISATPQIGRRRDNERPGASSKRTITSAARLSFVDASL
jgi:hypothetical protein